MSINEKVFNTASEQPAECIHIFGNMATWPRPCWTCGKTESAIALEKATELLANFKSAEPESDATDIQRLKRKLEEWQACYAMLFKQMTELVESSHKPVSVSLEFAAKHIQRNGHLYVPFNMEQSRAMAKSIFDTQKIKYVD